MIKDRKSWVSTPRYSGRVTASRNPDWIDRNQRWTNRWNINLLQTEMGPDKTYMLDRYQVWVNGSLLWKRRDKYPEEGKKNDGNRQHQPVWRWNRIETVANVNGTESYRSPLIVHYTPGNLPGLYYILSAWPLDRFSILTTYVTGVKDIRDLAIMLKSQIW